MSTKTPTKKAAASRAQLRRPPTVGEYDPAVPLRNIVKHPHNPRHRATADEELVASVRASGLVQPIVVAPHDVEGAAEHPERYVLVAGHRRLDALKKAGAATAPTIIRRDLTEESQQIEAMLVENGRRQDLTPLEEAEGYHQLELLGYKPGAIATAVGRDAKTVRARLKLLKLSPATQKKVHAGQFRLEDAAAVAEFASDPDATARLEAATKGHADNFRYQLQRERRRADLLRTIAATRAKLLDRGATAYELADDESSWRPRGAARLADTHSDNWEHHNGCLGYIETEGVQGSDPSITPVCLKPKEHQDQLDAAERERRDAAAEQQAQREAAEAARTAAATVRLDTLLELVDAGDVLPSVLADIVRALLPLQVARIHDRDALTRYQDAMSIPAAARWIYISEHNDREATPNRTKLRDHVDDIATWQPVTLARGLVAVLAIHADHNFDTTWAQRRAEARRYAELLREAGHPFCDVDNELTAKVIDTEAAAS